ncbi:MAG: 16S rRNA (cytidine(1402)-2'-O)-methyltransferase [Ruminococcus sp.]|nr:16S rRNA (cytidine(1402)-2'-O)-methyltransferase [Ruminococcus sp.]
MSGKLYVVGTPIGNLSDFSPRAVETLASVDFIAAEDTRVTLKLLNHFEIKKPMVSYFEHNRRERGEIILERIKSGENCAIVTDAGMPAISDPGEDLVDLCLSNGITVESVPGPTAFATAMAMSGLPSGRFTFEGFLSVNKPSRREHLEEIVSERRTMVFYEAPHKLTATLKDLYKYLGDRRIALIKELTKIHETVERTTLSEACEKYSAQTPKGEFVIVIEGSTEPKQKEVSLDEAVALAKGLVENGMAINDAAKEIAK